MSDIPKMPRVSSEAIAQAWTEYVLDPVGLWNELQAENLDLAIELLKIANADASVSAGLQDVEQSSKALRLVAFAYTALKRALDEEAPEANE